MDGRCAWLPLQVAVVPGCLPKQPEDQEVVSGLGLLGLQVPLRWAVLAEGGSPAGQAGRGRSHEVRVQVTAIGWHSEAQVMSSAIDRPSTASMASYGVPDPGASCGIGTDSSRPSGRIGLGPPPLLRSSPLRLNISFIAAFYTVRLFPVAVRRRDPALTAREHSNGHTESIEEIVVPLPAT